VYKVLIMNRRHFLVGTSMLGVASLMGTYEATQWFGQPAIATGAMPFYGLHQPGVITPDVATTLAVAMDVTATSKAELEQLFKTLTQRITFLMSGGQLESLDPKFPPAGSGILGATFPPDNLTISVGVGASLFDERYGLAPQRPKHLSQMANFPNDRLDPKLCHGDLLLQFCSNHNETNLHALRDIVKQLSGLVAVRWQMSGFQQPNTLKGPNRTSVRNLLGFKDGTANPDSHNAQLMNRLVWVQPNNSEPTWAVGGTYQVVRIIRMFTEFWDRVSLEEQEQIFGRHRESGSPLGYKREEDIPNYARDPKGKIIPLDAHIRLANPRTPATEANRVLRKGFHYTRGVDKAGQLDMGLLFVAFQQDLDRGFITIQNRLDGEPLEEYVKPIGGGYFFVLPGVPTPASFLGQSLLA
jgi:deferrochelatase/peroxidase EfeB